MNIYFKDIDGATWNMHVNAASEVLTVTPESPPEGSGNSADVEKNANNPS